MHNLCHRYTNVYLKLCNERRGRFYDSNDFFYPDTHGHQYPNGIFLSGMIGTAGRRRAIPAAWLTGLILPFSYYKSGRWKSKTVVKYQDNL